MRADKHFRLHVLGTPTLEIVVDGVERRPVPIRPRHLAILTLLVTSTRPIRRETLAAMFWGDETDSKARHSLSNALSVLRGALGQSAIGTRRDVIELNPDLRLAVDAAEFTAACEARDDERAVALYGGPFLHDLDLADGPDFEAWVARERGRLDRLFVAVCERRVPALLREREFDACTSLAERWLRAAPRSSLAFTFVLRARSGPGTPEAARAALADYFRLRDWLALECGTAPDPSVSTIVDELELRISSAERTLAAAVLPTAGPDASEVAPSPMIASPSLIVERATQTPVLPRSRRRIVARVSFAAGAIVLLAAALVRPLHPSHVAPITPSRTVVAITGVTNLRGDTALSWLEDGLPQLISNDLAAAGVLDPVAPMRIRDVLIRRGARPESALSPTDALDLARRVGATWAVRGGVTAGGRSYVLSLEVFDVASGSQLESFSVTAEDPVKLGELAAARLLGMATSAVGSAQDPPRFNAATLSPEAYRHFVLGLRAVAERRFSTDERELDQAIALDSSFVDALLVRRDLARARNDETLARRLDSLVARSADRLSEWDRLHDETYRALWDAEVDRSEALAAKLVSRYPRDPRAYDTRADVLSSHGKWLAADSVLQRELSLDSLAIEAGNGPCAPCEAYAGLVGVRLSRGDLPGAEQAARRWVALQPAVPGAWEMLSISLEFEGRFDDAIAAARRMVSLTSDPSLVADLARTLVIARRFGEADSLIAVLRTMSGVGRDRSVDLSITMARERGQFARAATLASAPDLIQADDFARLGRIATARRVYEASAHAGAPRASEALNAAQARAFAWAHALEADAVWRVGDTILVRALADSVRLVGARSYYGRDWRLYHHLEGLLALSRHDTTSAEREFSAARYGVAGWTSTLAMLGRIRLARGDGDGAVTILRDAYKGPLDAMGRYVTRTELDELMALSFARAGRADSAQVYAARVRAAWNEADPGVRHRLSALP